MKTSSKIYFVSGVLATIGGFIHVLLVIAVIIVLLRLIQGKRIL